MKQINKKLIKNKFYSTYYFIKTKKVLNANDVHDISLMQWKTNKNQEYLVAGMNEILATIKAFVGKKNLKKLTIKYAPEGSIVKPNQCALSIKGEYNIFCELENIIDSILARRCSVATNCYQILRFIKPEQLIFMSDRSDDYRLQPYDGYAAYIGGVRNFSNYSHIKFIKQKNEVSVFGSMPHALIQQFDGNIIKTFEAYKKVANDGSILVDFDNDIIGTLKQLKPKFKEIKNIRLDTSINMIDKSLIKYRPKQYGVTTKLVKLVRKFLNNNDGKHIKIIVTSNNNLEKIKLFVKEKAPIDFYGIGTYLTSLNLHFTADLVEKNNHLLAKVGRFKLNEDNLVLLK